MKGVYLDISVLLGLVWVTVCDLCHMCVVLRMRAIELVLAGVVLSDTENIRFVFAAVKDTILQLNLKEYNLV